MKQNEKLNKVEKKNMCRNIKKISLTSSKTRGYINWKSLEIFMAKNLQPNGKKTQQHQIDNIPDVRFIQGSCSIIQSLIITVMKPT